MAKSLFEKLYAVYVIAAQLLSLSAICVATIDARSKVVSLLLVCRRCNCFELSCFTARHYFCCVCCFRNLIAACVPVPTWYL